MHADSNAPNTNSAYERLRRMPAIKRPNAPVHRADVSKDVYPRGVLCSSPTRGIAARASSDVILAAPGFWPMVIAEKFRFLRSGSTARVDPGTSRRLNTL
eukprot:5780276-Pleurochrysis_carterae.AAC.1